MDSFIIDFLVSLFFLTALVVTAKSRKHISEEGSEAYKYISTGLVVLSFAAVSRLAFHQGLFNSLPFISEDLFYNLSYSIMIITGIVLLANGITYWLPLNQSLRKYNKTHFRHLSLLKDVEQLIAVEDRPDYIIQKSLDHMTEHFNSAKGAAFMYSSGENQVLLLSGDETENDQLEKIRLNINMINKNEWDVNNSIDDTYFEFPEDMAPPEVFLPVFVDGKSVAIFLLWVDSPFAYEDDLIVLKIAADIVGRAIKTRRDDFALEYFQSQEKQLNHIRNLFNYNSGIRDNLTRVVQHLKEILDIDYVTLIVTYSMKDIHRFTIGCNGTILCEKGLDLYEVRNIESNNKCNDPIQIISKNSSHDSTIMNTYLKESGMGTFISCSLDNSAGLLNIGIDDVREISLREKLLLSKIRQIFSQYISGEINKFNEDRLSRRFTIANKFLEDVTSNGSAQQVFEKGVRVIMQELRTSMVRIASFEDEGTFLKSRAISLVHQNNNLIPEDGYMVLSLMPTINNVKETGETKLINQADPNSRISPAEVGQLYSSDLSTALLVPIKMGNDVQAIIILADRRKETRYQYTKEDILFVSSIAKALSISLNMNSIEYETVEVSEVFRKTQDLNDSVELKGSIRSYLSGINGSVEMIKSHHPGNDEYLNQYLSVIDRSVRSINDCISRVSETSEEKETTIIS